MLFPLMANDVKVSVLTCSPGSKAYELYGHTGLRYCNENRGVDVVFNYGFFDFDAPNFIWRFIIGETDYMVGAVPYDIFCRDYLQRGSAVVEQQLELTSQQENELFDMLVRNCRPENRIYRYNYFYNNCTTKIRDKVEQVTENVVYDSSAKYPTLRDALNAMLADSPWYAFGINLLLGADIDRRTTVRELQFIPNNFMADLDNSYIISATGERVPFVKEKRVHTPESDDASHLSSGGNNFTPFNVALMLLVATFIVMSCEVRKKKTFWWFDVVIMVVQGLAGCLLLFMALFSQHPAVGNNWLLLLLNPLPLVLLPIYVCRIRKQKPLSVAWIQVMMATLFFLSAIFSLQVYPLPIYFCAAAILVRSLFLIYKKNICELSRF